MQKTTSLFQKDFTLVVIGQIISLFGNSILRFALPLYLLHQTGSAALFGIVTAISFLPMIVLSLLGGVMADRTNKRNIMVILDFSTAVLILLFSIALKTLPLVPVFITILMLLYGIQGIYQPAVQASIPILVSPQNLMSGNAIISQISALSGLAGPIIGGILFGFWGLSPILMISIICFTFSAIMEIFIHIPHKRQQSNDNIITIVRKDLSESLEFIKIEKPIFFRVMGLLVMFNLFLSSMLIIGLPVLLTKTLGMSDRLFGYSQGALAAGGLAGGIFVGILGKKLDIKQLHFLLLATASAVFPMVLALLLPMEPFISYLIITVMSFFIMSFSTIFSVMLMAFVQAQTPVRLVGKVVSCLLALSMCAQPIGQAFYGVLFETFSSSPWIIILGGTLISVCIAIYSKKVFCNIKE